METLLFIRIGDFKLLLYRLALGSGENEILAVGARPRKFGGAPRDLRHDRLCVVVESVGAVLPGLHDLALKLFADLRDDIVSHSLNALLQLLVLDRQLLPQPLKDRLLSI